LHVEREVDCVRAAELNFKVDVHQRFIRGQHPCLLIEALDGLDVDDLLGFDRPRQVPTQTWLRGGDVLAEPHDQSSLGSINLIQTRECPNREQHEHDRADTEAARRTAHRRTTARAAAENAPETTAQVAKHLVQIGWTLIGFVTATPGVAFSAGITAGFVPRHVGSIL
jgi:hypothetical protein